MAQCMAWLKLKMIVSQIGGGNYQSNYAVGQKYCGA